MSEPNDKLTQEYVEKLVKLLISPEFEELTNTAHSNDELVSYINEHGINITANELEEFLNSIDDKTENDVLSEEDLELVSGGGAITNWFKKQINKLKEKVEYFFCGEWIADIASGKRKHPWWNG